MKPNNNKQTLITDEQILALEKIVLTSCVDAGKYVRRNALNIGNIEWKKTDDPVTYLDKATERMIKKSIADKINANFQGEEYGLEDNGSDITIYIDPIDGTKSFARGEYLSSVSVAAELNGEIVVGAVYDFMREILYYANPKGAFIKTPYAKKSQALPIINFNLSKPTISFTDDNDSYKKTLPEILGTEISARKQSASIALSMAQLAAGSYEGLIIESAKGRGNPQIHDIAAGYYIMKQAGLKITYYNLTEFNYRELGKGLIALKPELYSKVLDYTLSKKNPIASTRLDKYDREILRDC
jgi:myo-inositol-1(or 4)-monophosphatase